MIKINLLPLEKRKAERTPLPRFGLILANVAVAAAVVLVMIIEFILIGVATSDRNKLAAEKVELEPFVAEWTKANELKIQQTARLDEVKRISGSPVDWWRVIDALWDVIHENPKVWIDDITMLDASGAKSVATGYDPASTANPPFGLSFGCHCSGLDVATMTKFRNDLRLKDILRRTFKEINFNPEYKADEHDEFAEKFSLAFKVQMIASEKPAAPPPAPPPAAKTGP